MKWILRGVLTALLILVCRYVYENAWGDFVFTITHFLDIVAGDAPAPVVEKKVIICITVVPLLVAGLAGSLASGRSNSDDGEDA